jgi:hypothetical protein
MNFIWSLYLSPYALRNSIETSRGTMEHVSISICPDPRPNNRSMSITRLRVGGRARLVSIRIYMMREESREQIVERSLERSYLEGKEGDNLLLGDHLASSCHLDKSSHRMLGRPPARRFRLRSGPGVRDMNGEGSNCSEVRSPEGFEDVLGVHFILKGVFLKDHRQLPEHWLSVDLVVEQRELRGSGLKGRRDSS